MKNRIITALVLIILGALLILAQPNPKYVYPVRENITWNSKENSITWELWCWKEYPNGKINKFYMGNFKFFGTTINHQRTETNLCTK